MIVDLKGLSLEFIRMPKEKRDRITLNTLLILAFLNMFGLLDVRRVTDVLRQWPAVIETQEKHAKDIQEIKDGMKEIRKVLSDHHLATDLKKKDTAITLYDN